MILKLRLFLLFALLFSFFTAKAQTNRALFVAIDQYPSGSGWSEIHATNDYKLILPMLKKSGYSENNIQLLLNEKATKSRIVSELKKTARQSRPGDHIYIHFSCHGQQMFDDNGDEEDGLDEALIPYDAKRRYSPGKYEGENHLRDDELEILTEAIRTNIGTEGNLIVVLDACHSGTGTRYVDDDDYIRGTSYIFAPDNLDFSENDAGKFNLHLKKAKYLSPITVFSACSDDEVNFEYRDDAKEYYGSLTYAFCRAVKTSSGIVSNFTFSEKLKQEMNSLFAKRKKKQTPYFESTDDNQPFKIGK